MNITSFPLLPRPLRILVCTSLQDLQEMNLLKSEYKVIQQLCIQLFGPNRCSTIRHPITILTVLVLPFCFGINLLLRQNQRKSGQGGDLLRPTRQKSIKILVRSKATWQRLLSQARRRTQFPESCSNITSLLNQTPSLPNNFSDLETATRTMLYLEGYSQWKFSSAKNCDLSSETKRSQLQKVTVGVTKPVLCELSDDILRAWPGFEGLSESSSRGNYLGIFVLGWSYVLSARLVELRGGTEGNQILYTDNTAVISSNDVKDDLTILIGDGDASEYRWWAAVLASGCGWQAVLNSSGKVYYPPWSCHLSQKQQLKIHYGGQALLSSLLAPPSSMDAQTYLCNFARLHNAYDQLLAAFVACLTVPSALRFGAPVILPSPKRMPTFLGDEKADHHYNFPITDQIPHLMLLSCLPNAITSCLFGSFWEPGVECNLVSEWLHPIAQELLPSLIKTKQSQVIVQIMAARRPNSAPLWLGSAITGLLPKVLSILQSHVPPICLEAVIWIGSPQSFMDPLIHDELQISHGTISREDEFRLLYWMDTQSEIYGPPPKSSYPPLGAVLLLDTAIEVRMHASCGHQVLYGCWTWRKLNGKGLDDYVNEICRSSTKQSKNGQGLDNLGTIYSGAFGKCQEYLHLTWHHLCAGIMPRKSTLLSESATRNLFSWTYFSDGGIRREELELWEHDWLKPLLAFNPTEESVSSSASGASNPSSKSFIDRWRRSVLFE